MITSSQAGASFRYALLWTLIPGIIGFAVFADMSGRVAISTGRTTFDVIRDRLGGRLGLLPLVATTLVNVLTLVVEISGMALAVDLGAHLPLPALAAVFAVVLVAVILLVGFERMDNSAALLGLATLVTVAANGVAAPEVGRRRRLPVPPGSDDGPARRRLPVHGHLTARRLHDPAPVRVLLVRRLEQNWTGKDPLTNRTSAIVGTVFGGVVTLVLMVVAAVVLFPHHHQVQSLADAAAPTKAAFGAAGLALFALGTFAVNAGAGLQTALAGTYTVCQFFGWDRGKRQRPGRCRCSTSSSSPSSSSPSSSC